MKKKRKEDIVKRIYFNGDEQEIKILEKSN